MTTRNRKHTGIAKRRARHQTERPTPPAERLAYILKLYDEHGCALPPNPLTAGATPLEMLKRCIQLSEWLYLQAFNSVDRDKGSQHVHLMLVGALNTLNRELEPLFETARAITDEVRL